MIKSDEDDEFERIERENSMKGQPYIYENKREWIGLDQTTKPDIRHQAEAFFAGVQWAETRLKELNS